MKEQGIELGKKKILRNASLTTKGAADTRTREQVLLRVKALPVAKGEGPTHEHGRLLAYLASR